MSETNRVEVPILITAFRVDDVKWGDIVTVKSGGDEFCQFQVRSCDGSEEFHPVGGLSVDVGETLKGCRDRVRDRDAELDFAVMTIADTMRGCVVCPAGGCEVPVDYSPRGGERCLAILKQHIIETAQKRGG